MVYSKSSKKKEFRRRSLKKTIKGVIKLLRLSEYFYAVIITTFIGAAASRGSSNWQLLIVTAGNLFGVGFAFMVNDIKDAPDDVLSLQKTNRNPISTGLISTKTAKGIAFTAAIFSLGLFAFLGYWPLGMGCVNLFLGYFYSIRRIRTKIIAFRSILSRALLITGLPFLISYFTFTSKLAGNWFWPFIFLLTINITGEFHHQTRQYNDGLTSKTRYNDNILGERVRNFLLITLILIVLFSGVVTIFMIQLFPLWIILTWAAIAIIFLLPPLIRALQGKGESRIWGTFQKPLERSAALTLILLYLIPWVDKMFNLGLFQ